MADLKRRVGELGLETKGTKAELIARVEKYLSEQGELAKLFLPSPSMDTAVQCVDEDDEDLLEEEEEEEEEETEEAIDELVDESAVAGGGEGSGEGAGEPAANTATESEKTEKDEEKPTELPAET